MSTTQIAVRLADKYVAFLDEQVKAGAARSRAELVESALEREIARRLDEHYPVLYTGEGGWVAHERTVAASRAATAAVASEARRRLGNPTRRFPGTPRALLRGRRSDPRGHGAAPRGPPCADGC